MELTENMMTCRLMLLVTLTSLDDENIQFQLGQIRFSDFFNMVLLTVKNWTSFGGVGLNNNNIWLKGLLSRGSTALIDYALGCWSDTEKVRGFSLSTTKLPMLGPWSRPLTLSAPEYCIILDPVFWPQCLNKLRYAERRISLGFNGLCDKNSLQFTCLSSLFTCFRILLAYLKKILFNHLVKNFCIIWCSV